ncbi:MAG: Re/Si-specific NAD(P)(+) transhydrogenase subunit alpha [Alphaproteobacteria bacterium]|nr:Re/Si-specific NAD(P)(+) transhydrogenase subunit alpha [Alphaproteobacteria bacterium]
MRIAVLREKHADESRVAATPETTRKMLEMGLKVVIEKDAGLAAHFSNDAYKDAGAELAKDATTALKIANVVLTVQGPLMPDDKAEELSAFPEGCHLIGMLNPLINLHTIPLYAKQGVNAFSIELVPRITRAQTMDVLSSQSNLAGYRAVIEAAAEYSHVFPMMMTAAGTIPPTRVLVLGAGVAGLQAIATARRLGAVVSAFDVRKAAKEQVESLGATFVEVESIEDSETKGGYAKETTKQYQKLQAEKIHEHVKKNDIVITTALIPGKPSPILITEAMVKDMKPGSVIVDLAAVAGGNCALTEPGKVIIKHQVKIIAHTNTLRRIATDASELYARNILSFLKLLLDSSGTKLQINREDEIISSTLLTYGGKIIHNTFKN